VAHLELLEAFFHADVFNVSAHAVLDLEAHGDGVAEGKHLIFGQYCHGRVWRGPVHHRERERQNEPGRPA
jgi:hypothetical protein